MTTRIRALNKKHIRLTAPSKFNSHRHRSNPNSDLRLPFNRLPDRLCPKYQILLFLRSEEPRCRCWGLETFGWRTYIRKGIVRKLERSVPAPTNPRPPARETLTARRGPAMMRRGAETTRGVEVHG
jgi:hypothetical protein